MTSKRCASVAVICVALAACGGTEAADGGYTIADSAGVTLVRNLADTDWNVTPHPTLVEDLRIGTIDGSPETEFTNIVGIDVGSDGRIYVLDRSSSNVRVFAPDGSYLRTLGREGQGPGELRRGGVSGVFVTPTDTVWVADATPGPNRLVAFTPEGEAGPTIPLAIDPRGTPREWAAGPNGRAFVRMESRSEERPDLLLLEDSQTGVADTLFQLQTPDLGPLSTSIQWAILDDGRIVVGRTDEHRFLILRADGSLDRVVTRAVPLRRMSDQDRASLVASPLFSTPLPARAPESLRQRIESQNQGRAARLQEVEFFHAYTRMIAGPGNTFWTRRDVSAEEIEAAGGFRLVPNLWDVYDAEGRYLGPLELPKMFTPHRAAGDHLYGVEQGEDMVPYVVRLRLAS
jgi:hypothetical protein